MLKLKLFISIAFLCLTKTVIAADFYWVGGSGNWSEINKWRTSSGGSTTPNVIPGPTDNVYFDQNSGFTTSNNTVTIVATSYCHNIIFNGAAVAPTLTQNGSQILNIYGSSEWQTGMNPIDIHTIYYKNNTTNKTIKNNGVIVNSTFYYIEETTTVTLLDNLFLKNTLYHNSGTLDTSGFTLDLGAYSASTTSSKKLILNNSTVYIRNGSFNSSSSLILDSGTSTIIFFQNNSSIYAYSNQTFNNVIFESTGLLNGSNIGVSYNTVEFKDDGKITNSFTFANLIFAAEKNYTLTNKTTQTITNSFTAITPDCTGWSNISSDDTNIAANILATATVTVSNLQISGAVITAISVSGQTFTANNSIDNGNNTGWTFISPATKNLYWVGGSGSWNDHAHWSNTSGGVGGYCEPGPFDNTFFDSGSGFTSGDNTVTITNTANTNNITFDGSSTLPKLTQTGNQILNIYGSSVWQQGMATIDVTNIYYRKSTAVGKTITSNGVKTGTSSQYVNIDEFETGSISLADNFYTLGNLRLTGGTFNTEGYDVEVELNFQSMKNTNAKTLNLSSSNFYLKTFGSYFDTNDTDLQLNAGTSNIIFSAVIPVDTNGSSGFIPNGGQTFYNVTFEKDGSINNRATSTVFYNKVLFMANGRIRGDNTYNELIFSPSSRYILEVNKTQYINNIFTANNSNCTWGNIYSTSEGTQAKIHASASATIDVSRIVMTDIEGSGTPNFIANESINESNNSGWTFTTTTGSDFYWINGNGRWSDKSHWASTSGGSSIGCTPGPLDNTIFDENSGFVTNSTGSAITNRVLVDIVAFTKNITFKNTIPSDAVPNFTKLTTSSQILNIFGSSEWREGMPQVSIDNIYYKNTGISKNITSNGVLSAAVVTLKETTSINLLDAYDVSNLYLDTGTFNTNNYDVKIRGDFRTNDNTNSKHINLGSSIITFSGSNASFNLSYGNNTIDAGTSHIIFTSLFTDNQAIMGLMPYTNQTFYDVTFYNGGTLGGAYTNTGFAAANFNKVEFYGNGTIFNSNTYKSLIFAPTKTYTLAAGKTQETESLIIGGTPCETTTIKSSSSLQTNLKVTGDTTTFNFAIIEGINNIGQTLYFLGQSTNNGNNTNLNFSTYDPTGFIGLGPNWEDLVVNTNVESTYIIDPKINFNTNQYSTYKWYKTSSTTPNVVISTSPTLNILDPGMGYGTYKVDVTYSDYTGIEICVKDGSLTITPGSGLVNPAIRNSSSLYK